MLEWSKDGIDISDSADDETYFLFVEWQEHACEHENFYYYYDRVANVSGGTFFFGAMDRLGQENFPWLTSIGREPISTGQASEMQMELDILESRVSELKGNYLVDSKSIEEYVKALSSEERWFYSTGGKTTYRINDKGFGIVDREKGELFRSMAFIQEVMNLEREGRNHRLVRFRDIESGVIYESNHPFSKKIEEVLNKAKIMKNV